MLFVTQKFIRLNFFHNIFDCLHQFHKIKFIIKSKQCWWVIGDDHMKRNWIFTLLFFCSVTFFLFFFFSCFHVFIFSAVCQSNTVHRYKFCGQDLASSTNLGQGNILKFKYTYYDQMHTPKVHGSVFNRNLRYAQIKQLHLLYMSQ